MPVRLYLDTSAILRAVLETGTSREIEERIGQAEVLITSRLTHVESARTFLRLRAAGSHRDAPLSDAEREVADVLARCELWEISPSVCELACRVAPVKLLRALDAIHLATFLLARRRLRGLEMLTADERLREAAGID
jgi:predicted nucleic acid-binding protein